MGKGLEEREISLWDMFWAICLKWRSVLVCAIICAILAGGFGYYRNVEDSAKMNADVQAVLEEDEKGDVECYLKYLELMKQQQEYNNNSILMNLSADGFWIGTLTYYIDNFYDKRQGDEDTGNNNVAIVNSYKSVLDSEELLVQAREVLKMDKDSWYVREYFDSENLYPNINTPQTDVEKGVITIAVYTSDEKTCGELLELVRSQVEKNKTQATQMFGKHDIIQINESVSFTVNNAIIEYQRDNIDELRNYKNAMNTLEGGFSEVQKLYIQNIGQDTSGEIQLSEQTHQNYIDYKWIVLGFFGGAVLMFLIWGLAYLFGGKIRLEDDFESVFKVKLLGNILFDEKKKKKWFAFIDDTFMKIRHYNQRYFEVDEALDMIAANIRIEMKKAGVNKIMITGAACDKEEKTLVELLNNLLREDGIEIIFESSVLYNAEALEKLVETGCVVLVEKAGKTLYQEVKKEIEICTQQEIKLVGCIVLS